VMMQNWADYLDRLRLDAPSVGPPKHSP
jgi:hypothetical protein